jgi:hypothetical protein
MDRGIDIPKIYLADKGNGKYECVDGKQRILSIFEFIFGDEDGRKLEVSPRTVDGLDHVIEPKDIKNYKLTICLLEGADEEYIRLTFRRLQLAKGLTTPEILKAKMGEMRDFIFKRLGKKCKFIRMTGLKDWRYSKELAIAQIILNSFYRRANDYKEFQRMRLVYLENFVEQHTELNEEDEKKLKEIIKIFSLMEKAFGKNAEQITSRAAVVSAYFFVEELYKNGKSGKIKKFADFYLELLSKIDSDLKRINAAIAPENRTIILEFHQNITQASVEPYSLERRHNFLKIAFEFYLEHGEMIDEDNWEKIHKKS